MEVAVPTPGFVVEPKLSNCSAAEDFVEQSRRIELTLRAAQADQARWEASRREQLLGQSPPQLGSFEPLSPALKVDLQQLKPPTP